MKFNMPPLMGEPIQPIKSYSIKSLSITSNLVVNYCDLIDRDMYTYKAHKKRKGRASSRLRRGIRTSVVTWVV